MAYKLLLALSLCFNGLAAQAIYDTVHANEALPIDLVDRITGVKYVNMYENDDYVSYLLNNQASIDAQLYIGFINFLKEDLGLDFVAISKDQLAELEGISSSICDFVKIQFMGEFDSDVMAIGSIRNVQATFVFCDGRIFFVQLLDYSVNGYTNHAKRIQKEFRKRFPNEIPYDSTKTLTIPDLRILASEREIQEMLYNDSTRLPIEGVYQFFSGAETHVEKVAIIKTDDELLLVYLSGKGKYKKDWTEGEVKGKLENTKSANDYIVALYSDRKREIKGSMSFEENAFTLNAEGQSYRFIKL